MDGFRRRSSSCGIFDVGLVDSIREEDEDDLLDDASSRGSNRSRSVSIDEKNMGMQQTSS